MLKAFVFLFFLNSCAFLSKPVPTKKAALYEKVGISFLQQKNYPAALSRLLKSEQLNPGNASTQSYLGLAYFALKKYKLSALHFQKASKIQPQQTEYKNNLAYSYIKLKKYKTAFKILKNNLSDLTYPFQYKTYFYLSLIQDKNKNLPLAYKLSKKSLNINKNFCPANLQSAKLLHRLKQYTESGNQFKITFARCPNYKNHNNLFMQAINYHKLKQYIKAVTLFKLISKNNKFFTSRIKKILKPSLTTSH